MVDLKKKKLSENENKKEKKTAKPKKVNTKGAKVQMSPLRVCTRCKS